ncbi:MAG: PTS sugar transporter subunit IIA [Erysipelotrichaceae bacterium]|nr:PTS sugar transporter subunit IIA [Erysipelotrichaceae bacterium]
MIDAIIEKSIRVLLNADGPITTSVISRDIGMSVSSVKHNMDYIKTIVKKGGCELVSIPGKGLWIEGNDEKREQLKRLIEENRDRSFYYNYRKNYMLSILFQNNCNYTIQIFADDLSVGKNIVMQDLRTIEKWLSNFDLKLERTRNKGVYIEGEEFNIRQAIILNNASRMDEVVVKDDKPDDIDYRISQNFYSYFTQIYPQYNIFELQEYLREVEDKLDLVYDDTSFSQLLEYIAVSFDRIRMGNIIRESTILNRCRTTEQQLAVATDMIKAVTRGKMANMEYEASCLAAEIAIYNAYGSNEESVIKEAYYNEVARIFVDNIRNTIANKNLLVNEKLIEDIGILFHKKKLYKTFRVSHSSSLASDIKRQSPSLYAVVSANAAMVESQTKISFSENDIAYMTMLIDNALEDSHIDLKILLYTSFDYNTGKYLENKIKKQVEGIHRVKVIRKDDLAKIDISEYDLVFSTSPCPIEGYIKITRDVNEKDISIISEHVRKRLLSKHEILTNVTNLFDEHLILAKQKFRNKNEVLEAAGEILKSQGYVSDNFIEELILKENKSKSEIGNGIAVSTVYKNEVIKSGILIMTLEKPIEWHDEARVDFIMVVVVNALDKATAPNLFARLFDLIDNHDDIRKIRDSESAKEIYRIAACLI